MATKKQKEELMATLKFTPRKYRIDIWGYGGEVYWGRVDRKVYDLFKEKAIDIEQYAGDWDDDKWQDIPNELRPFEPGSPYDIGGVHESGATFDDASTIVVSDENNNEVWRSPLGAFALEAAGVEFECASEDYLSEYEPGTPVFYGAQGEKGTFFGNDFEIRAPFDPKLLKITYCDCDGWELVYGIEYNGEEIDNSDYDTTGKWSEAKWIIVGDTEEVYEGEERDEVDEDDEDDDSEILGQKCVSCDWFGQVVDCPLNEDNELSCPECGALVKVAYKDDDIDHGEEYLGDMADMFTNLVNATAELGEQVGADEEELEEVKNAKWPYPPSVDDK